MRVPREDMELIERAVRAVLFADRRYEVVRALGLALRGRYDIVRVALLSFTTTGTALVEASWTAGTTVVAEGTEIAIALTPATGKIAELLLRGEVACFDPRSEEIGLLSDVFRGEGDRATMAVPFGPADRPMFLGFGSSRENAFDDEDMVLVRAIAVGIQDHALSLAE